MVIHEDKIAYAGAQSSIPAKFRSLTFTKVPVIMPGLWDCHVHFDGAPPVGGGQYDGIPLNHALAAARVVRSLEDTLLAGFTSVRELAGYGGEISPAIDEGSIVGPNVYSSIAALSTTGGHGDIHQLGLDAVINLGDNQGVFQLCDGVPECIKAVRKMIRRGAKVIKVCATGGVGSLRDDPEDTQFSLEELKAIVDEAARNKRVVAAHCHGKQGILNALNAGVKSIEHGSYLDKECAALMKEKDAIFVPTRTIVVGGVEHPEFWSEVQYAKLLVVAAASKKAYTLAIKSGVKIALGTDQSSPHGSFNSHGMNGKELWHAVDTGMTPLQAIEACTATSPETLGRHMSPKSGQLKEGYDADLIAVSTNPLDDISILTGPDHITHVWKGGKLFKSP